jgi:hypothetical protein
MLLINKINASLDVITLINMRATICMLILSGSNCIRKPVLRKHINGATKVVKLESLENHYYLVQAKEAQVCIQVVCLRRDLMKRGKRRLRGVQQMNRLKQSVLWVPYTNILILKQHGN